MGDIPEGPSDLQPLARAVQRADVDAGIFADEEVHIMTGRADDRPEAFIDAPRLAKLDEHDQDIALETAFWLLQAQGVATWDAALSQFKIVGVYAVVGELRQESEVAISVRVDERDEGTRRSAIYRVRPDLYLFEDVSDRATPLRLPLLGTGRRSTGRGRRSRGLRRPHRQAAVGTRLECARPPPRPVGRLGPHERVHLPRCPGGRRIGRQAILHLLWRSQGVLGVERLGGTERWPCGPATPRPR